MSRPTLCHYYHLYSSGNWVDAWSEQITEVIDSGLYEELEVIKIGVVGIPAHRQAAIDIVKQHSKVEIVVEKNGGYEQETLDVLRADILSREDETYVLYSHTKGSAYPRPINNWWRRDMIRFNIGKWQEAIRLLDDGYDATGVFWRTMPELGKRSPVLHPHFSGNFWWAKSSYLKTLGEVRRGTRYDAEAWIGYNPAIKHFDMHPGAPRLYPIVGPTPMKTLTRVLGSGNSTIIAYVNSRVLGPAGEKLYPGQIIQMDNTPYTQILIRSGSVTIWD